MTLDRDVKLVGVGSLVLGLPFKIYATVRAGRRYRLESTAQ